MYPNAAFSAGLTIFQATRINAIMQGLTDIRLLPAQLYFLSKTPVVPAVDGEIMARFIGTVQIADLIADDEKAAVYSNDKFMLETTGIPNLKVGKNLTQTMLNQLASIVQNGGVGNDGGIWTNYENRTIAGLLLGVRQRMEALLVAMKIDGFSYDRLGIKMNNVTWGMPSDLKITVGTDWTDDVNADGAGDILLAKMVGSVRYGWNYNRMVISQAALNYLTKQAKFQARARAFLPPSQSTAVLPLQNIEFQRTLAANILGLDEVVIYNARYFTQDSGGTVTQAAFLPLNKVILESTSDDNNAAVTDFANGVVTESIVSELMGSGMFGILPAQRGPVAYPTAPPDLNPPNITYWGVARGFPRKHVLQSNACLTVGTITDTIATSMPF